MKSQLLRRAAAGGNDEDIEVAVAVARERNPFAVRRETRISIARLVHGQALDVLPRLIGRPDVAEICEGDAAVRVTRIAHKFGFAAKRERSKRADEQQRDEQGQFFHGVLLWWRQLFV